MSDEHYMKLALDLAQRGEGFVEPNPMVGCVIVQDNEIVGQGWHEKFGGHHAEINAINSVDEFAPLNGATVYVTLEPCCHTGKTGPCSNALINAHVARVVVACADPNPQVAGQGIKQLTEAGIDVTTHCLADEARTLLAPYLKQTKTGMPWIIAKWAMTLDGKIATASGDSKWISNEKSRAIVHQIRGRADGVMIGIGTMLADDPMLNARPAGARVATRIVVDSIARTPIHSRLVETAGQFPTIIAVGPDAAPRQLTRLKAKDCIIFQSPDQDPNRRLESLLAHLANQGMTNILVEGGGGILGALNDLGQIDEVHAFIGPKLVGGVEAINPLGGSGRSQMQEATPLKIQSLQQLDDDIYVIGRTVRQKESAADETREESH